MSRPKNTILSICFVAALGLVGCGGRSAGGGDAGDGIDAGTDTDGGSPAVTLVTLTILPANPDIVAGTTRQFSATGIYSDSTSQDLTQAVTWSSLDVSIASIDLQGLATAHAQGTTTIKAALGTVSATTQLTVSPAALVSIEVTPAKPSIAVGTTQQFTATGTYSDNSVQGINSSVTWSSSDTSKATIDALGLATAVNIGSITITATATSGSISGSTALMTITAIKETIAFDGMTGQEPDPTLFARSGNLSPLPTANLGLVIMDPDGVSSLMYTHDSVFLSADPARAEFKNRATVVCRLKLPPFNGTGVGSRGAVGARVVLQDGGVRAELTFGVNAITGGREITVLSSGFTAAFPWDNDWANVYELARLGDGSFQIKATNGETGAALGPIPIARSSLPAYFGIPQFGFGTASDGSGDSTFLTFEAQVVGGA